jgi:cytochrome c oxidase cbb3-type subunit 4
MMEWLDLARDARALWTAWLLLLFVGIAWYALRPRNKKRFEDYSRIPFRADSEDQFHE